MSDAPISELEASSLEVLERSGWSNAELIWEQIQESAAQCNQAGDTQEAAEMWVGALEVAEQYFAPNDLRLATSISNRALALRRDGDLDTAKRLF
ncbi:MAG: tetratricopeptide repeat protein, partial [Gammaproteobacteria bacterium]|nr:tetratricopeptide repeat protein [Gammaproteobacteria bacterium]